MAAGPLRRARATESPGFSGRRACLRRWRELDFSAGVVYSEREKAASDQPRAGPGVELQGKTRLPPGEALERCRVQAAVFVFGKKEDRAVAVHWNQGNKGIFRAAGANGKNKNFLATSENF